MKFQFGLGWVEGDWPKSAGSHNGQYDMFKHLCQTQSNIVYGMTKSQEENQICILNRQIRK
jgi:hypothetical protein